MKTPVTPAKDGITLSLYVQPGAAKSGWAGMIPDINALKLRVAAKPVEGEANKAVCEFIARFLDVPKSAVSIMHGATGRNKVVFVAGDPQILLARMLTIAP